MKGQKVRSGGGKMATVLLIFEVIGAIFTGIFLAAYLSGLPSTQVLHSEPFFRMALIIMGGLFLATALLSLMLMISGNRKKKKVSIS